jgi:hypothetical protein
MSTWCLIFFQEQEWQVGAVTLKDSIFCGAPRVPSHDFRGKNLRSNIHWFCLAFALLEVLF